MLETYELLSEEECERVRTAVHEMEDFWFRRHPSLPFFVLGIPSYAHIAARETEHYRKRAAVFNGLMREEFGWLYDRIAAKLSELLDPKTCFAENLALPGFHIVLYHTEFFENYQQAIHCDVQYRMHDWGPREENERRRHISFTLPVALPKHGAGLNVWNLRLEDVVGVSSPEEVRARISSSEKRLLDYSLGKMLVHYEQVFHQIAPMPDMVPGDERITLQGHGVLLRGVWNLYW